MPDRYALLALSGCGDALTSTLSVLAHSSHSTVAVSDCPTGSAGAVATAMALLPGLRVVTGTGAFDAERLVAHASEVVAPAMDLSLASRIAAMQSDTPASRVVLRALLHGVPVRATLDEREFDVDQGASDGARRAVASILSKLRELGIGLSEPGSHSPPMLARAAAHGAGSSHPSQERFDLPSDLNEFIEYLEHRPCTIEPGKPCVECGACETRGF